MKFLKLRRKFRVYVGAWRLVSNLCPLCNSDAPAIDTCPICEGYHTADRGKPDLFTINAWKNKFQAHIDAKYGSTHDTQHT